MVGNELFKLDRIETRLLLFNRRRSAEKTVQQVKKQRAVSMER